jgi:hypothetical protein
MHSSNFLKKVPLQSTDAIDFGWGLIDRLFLEWEAI